MSGSGVSIQILTKNDHPDLPGCLAGVVRPDDVQLCDSVGTDDALAIVRRAGAPLTQRPFENQAAHQSWALRNTRFKHPWVFCIDADERVTPELVQAATNPDDKVDFRLQRHDFHERQYRQQESSYHLPVRLAVKFFLLYVGKRGFPSGRAGLTYAVRQSNHEYMMVLKVRDFGRCADPCAVSTP